MTKFLFFLLAFAAMLFPVAQGHGLTAQQIAVIANRRQAEGVTLARFYMQERHIPAENLITLEIDPAEACSASDYDRLIAAPVRAFLESHDPKEPIRCLVTMYGVPLKISSPATSDEGRAAVDELTQKIEQLNRDIEIGQGAAPDRLRATLADLRKQLAYQEKIHDQRAAVDSELSLVLTVHPLDHWLANPYFRGLRRGFQPLAEEKVLMVSRLDGPSAELVKRMITDSLAAEQQGGLHGSAYFDARWPDPGLTRVDSYGWYDRSIHRAAEIARQSGRLDQVVVDEKNELFQPGPHRPAALYCGWYSLARYVDAFDWQRGAVGYHIASSECSTLKQAGSEVWCKKMVEKGVAATIGPVGEPYVDAFPPPDLFFSFLTGGKNLVESYFFSLPYLSWKMVLLGDPLYTPFAVKLSSQ